MKTNIHVKTNEVVFGALFDSFAEEGNFKEAARYFQAMAKSQISTNQIILTSMLKAYAKIGSVDGDKWISDRVKKIFGDGFDIVVSNSMLHLYGELGMLPETDVLFDFLVATKQADGVTYATMIYVYKNMGRLDESVDVARQVTRSGLVTNCVTYNKIMACCATNGQLLKCCELLHDMVMDKQLSPDQGTFKVLFTILKEEGFQDRAVQHHDIARMSVYVRPPGHSGLSDEDELVTDSKANPLQPGEDNVDELAITFLENYDQIPALK